MIDEGTRAPRTPTDPAGAIGLEVKAWWDGRPRRAGRARPVARRARGEIVGMAGVSGNGQREMVEAIVGQRARVAGEVRVAGSLTRDARREPRLRLRACPRSRCATPASAT